MKKSRIGKFSTGMHGRREVNRRPYTISNAGYDAAIIELQHFHESEYLKRRSPSGGGQKRRDPAPPENRVAPIVFGSPYSGSDLMCTEGTWAGWPPPTYTYQWYRGSPGSETLIPGATDSLYTAQEADIGFTVFCRVTATNDEGSAAADSNVLGPIMDPAERILEDGVTNRHLEDGTTVRTLE